MTHDLTDTVPGEDFCRVALGQWCSAAGLPAPAWPLSEADALALLRDAGEFEATPAVLARCETFGWFSPPEGEWSARDVFAFAGILDAMRFWRPSPSVHDPKRGMAGVALSEAITSNTVRDIVDMFAESGTDLRRMLLMMVHQETRQARETLLWGVWAILHHRGVTL